MTISISDDIDDALCQLSNKTGIRYGAIFSSYVTITMDNKGDVSVIDEIIKYSIDLGINFSTLIGNDDNDPLIGMIVKPSVKDVWNTWKHQLYGRGRRQEKSIGTEMVIQNYLASNPDARVAMVNYEGA